MNLIMGGVKMGVLCGKGGPNRGVGRNWARDVKPSWQMHRWTRNNTRGSLKLIYRVSNPMQFGKCCDLLYATSVWVLSATMSSERD